MWNKFLLTILLVCVLANIVVMVAAPDGKTALWGALWAGWCAVWALYVYRRMDDDDQD